MIDKSPDMKKYWNTISLVTGARCLTLFGAAGVGKCAINSMGDLKAKL